MPVSSAAKLATHLWRGAAQSAANAAHNSASTLRSAFQGSATGTSGAGSSSSSTASSWTSGLSGGAGSAGAGTGGAKYHAGRNAHFTYQNSGRALSQASSSTTHDGNNGRNDDEEENRRQKAYQLRLRAQKGSPLRPSGLPSNLTTSQMQARFKHAFAADRGQALIASEDGENPCDRPGQSRAYSTEAAAPPPSYPQEVETSPETGSLPRNENEALRNSSRARIEHVRGSDAAEALYTEMVKAVRRNDPKALRAHVDSVRALPKGELTTSVYNMTLEALFAMRRTGQPVTEITQTYAEMVESGFVPNNRTFSVVVKALCLRDVEIQRGLRAAAERSPDRTNKAEMAEIRKEQQDDHYGQALQLMDIAHNTGNWFPDSHTYNSVLRSCAIRGDVNQALSVLDLLERSDFAEADSRTYTNLIRTFMQEDESARPEGTSIEEARQRKLAAVRQVFEEFLEACKRLTWNTESDANVWSIAIRAHFRLNDPAGGIALLERMLSKDVEKGVPVPAISTDIVSAVIMGFLDLNDLSSALDWFSKVASADQEQSGASMPLPDCHTLERLMGPLANQSDLLELFNRIFEVYLSRCEETGWRPQLSHLADVTCANAQAAQALLDSANTQDAQGLLDKAMEFTLAVYGRRLSQLSSRSFNPNQRPDDIQASVNALCQLADALVRSGRVVDGGSSLTYAAVYLGKLSWKSTWAKSLQKRLAVTGESFFGIGGKELVASPGLHFFAAAEFVAPVLQQANLLDETFAAGLAQLYRRARHDENGSNAAQLPLSSKGWGLVLDAFAFEERNLRPLDLDALKTDGIAMLLNDLEALPVSPEPGAAARPGLNLDDTVALLRKRYGKEGIDTIAFWLPEALVDRMELSSPMSTASEVETSAPSESAGTTSDVSTRATTPPQQLSPLDRHDLPHAHVSPSIPHDFPVVQVVDTDLGKRLWNISVPNGLERVAEMYRLVQKEAKVGTFPSPDGLAAIIAAYGRLHMPEKVAELYAMAQHVLRSLVGDPQWQSSGWFLIENAMIRAFAHAGDADAASAFRHRIIAAGGAPTANAYGDLIATVRDTTDDASIAQELFDESQRFGVRPSPYLFNTIISKLSRARKADRALQLFEDMTFNYRMSPTSVTYGAVINACTRIGDEEKAVELFQRMEADPSFKPRVPPYNTMMQFFIQNVPNREKALVYYNKMVEARVEPSAHTYKLLLDLHGAIDPVQPEQMMSVFEQIVKDPKVDVQGSHWASLINCYGCVLHDLDRAVAIFESIAKHPSTRAGKDKARPLPDAISFEALLAVFVAHHRTDLIRSHFEKMKETSGIKLTAYVANLLIRGFAMDGLEGLQDARQVFESMIEPVAGVAAPGNHPPRAHGAGAVQTEEQRQQHWAAVEALTTTISRDAPFSGVHREPSTYEAMIRAELAHGNRDEAHRLVERMEARAFPPALVTRARALIVDAPTDPSDAGTPGQSRYLLDHGDLNAKRYTFGQASPRLPHAGLAGAGFAPRPVVSSSASAAALHTWVRRASTAANGADASATSNPAPGPPKPNSPFTIFDRNAKTLQKDRAALKKAVTTSESGVQSVADEDSRGEVSRLTDYVRKAIAESLADRVQDIKRDFPTIVELGAGPGYLRHFLDAKGTGTKKIIMCDTSEAALRRDEHLDASFPYEFERRVVDEEALPFEEASLDCVVVSGGLHWTNDLPGVLVQIRKALKPDGVFIGGLCGGDTLFELRTSLQLAEQEREGGISPRVSPMADQRDMASLLQRAGFTIPTVDVDELSIAYPSMFELVQDLRDMGESNAVINRRPHLRRDTMLAASAIYQSLHGLEPQEEGDEQHEGVPATFSLIYLIGWAPAPSQPKPLKRGSAQRSLKDALGGGAEQGAEEEMSEEERQKLVQGFMMSINEKK